MREKEKQTQVKQYLDLLVHYDAKLVKSGLSALVVTQKTGAELPLDREGRLLMVKLLLDECGSVEAVNERVQRYRASHS
jgi:hypothetical protein